MVFLPEPGGLRPLPARASPAPVSSVLWLSQRPSLVVSSRMVSFWLRMVSFCCSTVSRSCSTLLRSSSAPPAATDAVHMSASTGTEVQMKRVGPKSWAALRRRQRASSAQVRAAQPAGMAAGAGPGAAPGSAELGLRAAPPRSPHRRAVRPPLPPALRSPRLLCHRGRGLRAADVSGGGIPL